jgi:hypothetical protein
MAKMIEMMVPSLRDTMAKACKRSWKRIEGVVEAGGDHKDIDEQHLQVWCKYVFKKLFYGIITIQTSKWLIYRAHTVGRNGDNSME